MRELIKRDVEAAIRYLEAAKECGNPTELLGYLVRASNALHSAAQQADLDADQGDRRQATGGAANP